MKNVVALLVTLSLCLSTSLFGGKSQRKKRNKELYTAEPLYKEDFINLSEDKSKELYKILLKNLKSVSNKHRKHLKLAIENLNKIYGQNKIQALKKLIDLTKSVKQDIRKTCNFEFENEASEALDDYNNYKIEQQLIRLFNERLKLESSEDVYESSSSYEEGFEEEIDELTCEESEKKDNN